jgi:outer membrane protein TolC
MSYRTAVWALMILMSGVYPSAQTQAPAPPKQPAKGGMFSIYKPPELVDLGTRREDTLESRVRDGRLELTEADVVQLALQNNVDIQVERYAPVYNLWQIEKSRGILNSSFTLAGTHNYKQDPTTSILQGNDPLISATTDYSATYRKPFVTGTDLTAGFTEERLNSSSTFYTFNPSYTSGFNFSITQHLLRDAGSLSRGHYLQVSQLNRDISEEDFATRVTDVLRSALDTYWDLVFLAQDIKVKEDSLNLAQVVLDQNRAQVDAGTLAGLDVTQAEAEVATRQEDLVTARYARRITEAALKKLISSRPDPGLVTAEITPTSQPPATPRAAAVNVAQAIQRAQDMSPEVRRALIDLESRKIDVAFTANQLKPNLDVTAGYSQSGLGGTRQIRDYSKSIIDPDFKGEIPGGVTDSLGSLFRGNYPFITQEAREDTTASRIHYYGYFAAINMRILLGNDDARATNAQSRILLAQAEERLRGTRQNIAYQVREAAERLERDRARVQSAEVTVRFNEQRLAGEQEKASQGESTTRFVLESQRDLSDARSRLARARADAMKAQIAYDRYAGELLSSQGVQVKQQLPLK